MNAYRLLAEALLSGKPYFGPALAARQGIPERHQYFRPVVSCVAGRRPNKGLEVLEIGSWAGASTITWAVALLQAGSAGRVTCVDPWEPYFDVTRNSQQHYEDMNEAARTGLIARLFEHNIRAAGVAAIVSAHRGASRDLLPHFPARSFDIVYVDGSHQFGEVCFDIDHAKRLVRDGGIICGDDLELEAAAVPQDELRDALGQNVDFVYSRAARSHYHPGVTAAVAREFTAVGVWDGFWAVQLCGSDWIPPVLDLTALQLPEHIPSEPNVVRLVASTAAHNLVEAGGRFFAIAKSIGSVDLFHEYLGDRELPPLLLLGDSLEEVRARSEAVLPSRATSPVVIGNHRGFNLVAYQGRITAVQTSLGPVDVAEGEAELERRFGRDMVLVADTADVARARIDSLAIARNLATVVSELASLRSAQESQVSEVASLRSAQESQTAHAQELHAHRAAAAENLRSQQSEIDGIRAAVEALRTTADSISHQFRLLSRQVELLQFGPGEPESPCVGGQHRGFELVHYQGHLYALRRPLEIADAQLGERELLQRHGSVNVVVGDSLDGVRARIDVLEGLKEMQAEVASLDQELSTSGSVLAGKLREIQSEISSIRTEFMVSSSRLASDLQQADSTLQSHAVVLERLSRSWPHRLLGIPR